MKRITTKICYAIVFALSGCPLFAQQWISAGNAHPSHVDIKLVKSDIQSTTLQLDLTGFYEKAITADGSEEFIISSPGTSSFLQSGYPDLGKIAGSVIIPDEGAMQVKILSSEFKDFENIDVAPSKGNLTRNINPADIAFHKGEVYSKDEFWPSAIVSMDQPYILRDYRGEAVVFNPFQYNPVKKTLRVFTSIKVEIEKISASKGINEFLRTKPLIKTDPEFAAIYKSHFINNVSVQYTPLEEQGDLLIICYSQWMNLMKPLVDWKIKKGIHTEIVDINNAGGSSGIGLQNYIANYYLNHNLTYVLLVGDVNQVPSLFSAGGVSDPVLGFITGNDAYSEVFIGRFSAETAQDVQTQVQRSLDYEMNVNTTQSGFGKGVVIGSNMGPGDDGEMDWEHAHNMRTDLIGYTYSQVDELYDDTHPTTTDAPGDPVPSDLLNLMISGTGVITYTGHGSSTSCSTTGISNSDLPSLAFQPNLPFIWSVACLNGDFAQTTGPCLAEGFLRSQNSGSPSGAVATFMASINQSWDPPMDAQDEMVDILTHQYTNNIKRSFAGLSFNGCFHMNDQYGPLGTQMTSTWHVFGDPTLDIRTATPSAMTVSHQSIINLGDSTLIVNCNTDSATVCLTLQGNILSVGNVLNGICSFSFPQLNVVDTIFVTVTALNKIPYQGYILILPSSVPYVVYFSHANNDFNGNKDGIPDFGELIAMDITLKDLSFINSANTSAKLTSNDTNIVIITNSYRGWGNIIGNSTLKLDSAFTYLIKNNVPDQHIVEFNLEIHDNAGHTWNSKFNQILNAPNLEITSMYVDDAIGGNNNGTLESNESGNLVFRCSNTGHSNASASNAILSSGASFLTLNATSKNIGLLTKQSYKDVSFSVTMGNNVAIGTPYDASLQLTSGGYESDKTFYSSAGNILEDFETGDFTKYNWLRRSPIDWSITNVLPYQGSYSAVSGDINDLERTDLEITLNVFANDSLSFWYKVSSEAGWDFMRVYMDGMQLQEYSGLIPWTYTSFGIEPGIHTFIFSYQKDGVNSFGSDCAWIDNIRFPYSTVVTGIKNISSNNNLNIYPNPASDHFNIDVDAKQNAELLISILDIKGSLINKLSYSDLHPGKQSLNVSADHLSNGLYFIRVENGDYIKTYKLSIQR